MKPKCLLFTAVIAIVAFMQCTKETNIDSQLKEKSLGKSGESLAQVQLQLMCEDCHESTRKITGSQAFNHAWTFS